MAASYPTSGGGGKAVLSVLPDLWRLPVYLPPCCGRKAAVADFKFSFHEIAFSYSFSADFVAGCILSFANHCFIDVSLDIILFKKRMTFLQAF